VIPKLLRKGSRQHAIDYTCVLYNVYVFNDLEYHAKKCSPNYKNKALIRFSLSSKDSRKNQTPIFREAGMNQPSPSPIIQFHPFYCYTKVTPAPPRTVHPTMLADGPAQQINRTIVDRLTSSSKTKIKISKASQSAVNDRTRVFSHRTRRRTDERVCHGLVSDQSAGATQRPHPWPEPQDKTDASVTARVGDPPSAHQSAGGTQQAHHPTANQHSAAALHLQSTGIAAFSANPRQGPRTRVTFLLATRLLASPLPDQDPHP